MHDPAPEPYRRPDLLRLSYDDYRALPAIANSDLSRLRDALNGRVNTRLPSTHAAASLGTAFHTALLEPTLYEPGLPGINDTLIWWMVEGVRLHEDLQELLTNGIAEPSCVFTEPVTGTMCKLRADLVVDGGPGNYTIIDFKTTAARDYSHFVSQCYGYDYDRQAAFYTDALQADRFLLVGVQKLEPFHVFTVEVTPQMLTEGRAKYQRLLAMLKPEANLPPYLSEVVREVVNGFGQSAEE
ncbi:PD-(D/E)XK nuclease-like domain-containing protein [Hymenobacter sp. BT175]|uniref:PD-(D/E)XK nuclease-like domain-containing protein n=1 Tax=Hymenobacter translucens TaxID=2886507 RepID=UPI001D0DECA3|nr:PD-(D/E)XK nuclease-like domain-containing protein [Hymenobacter translucens]MCC2546597.1 PD-(D/E)XK nuclease-like domain-containing protein [Hymenobacter translucens]